MVWDEPFHEIPQLPSSSCYPTGYRTQLSPSSKACYSNRFIAFLRAHAVGLRIALFPIGLWAKQKSTSISIGRQYSESSPRCGPPNRAWSLERHGLTLIIRTEGSSNSCFVWLPGNIGKRSPSRNLQEVTSYKTTTERLGCCLPAWGAQASCLMRGS